ncbi:hypothetical protein Tsubulata_012559 [Turnera subulata]|uniref:CCHC-type domain-containing protein n=1 Tax=Turnera subulata TaxID=218843 RepID=A0A9Q0JKQ5_9ROSI|nr:hypothetical protein Tsubulata_012559 [Turnera subulata]
MGEENCASIASMVGELVRADFTAPNGVHYSSYMWLEMTVLVDEPLVPGFLNEREDGEEVWVQFKYDKLPDICYRCGRMGHIQKACSHPASKYSVKYLMAMRAMKAEHWVRRGVAKAGDAGKAMKSLKRGTDQQDEGEPSAKVARVAKACGGKCDELINAAEYLERESVASGQRLAALLLVGGLEESKVQVVCDSLGIGVPDVNKVLRQELLHLSKLSDGKLVGADSEVLKPSKPAKIKVVHQLAEQQTSEIAQHLSGMLVSGLVPSVQKRKISILAGPTPTKKTKTTSAQGYKYTWDNGREYGGNVKLRLDRVLCSLSWQRLFHGAKLVHLQTFRFDHLPLKLLLREPSVGYVSRGRGQGKFEEHWLRDNRCEEIVLENEALGQGHTWKHPTPDKESNKEVGACIMATGYGGSEKREEGA